MRAFIASLDEDITYWKKASDEADNKEAALVAFGVYAGFKLARADYLSHAPAEEPEER